MITPSAENRNGMGERSGGPSERSAAPGPTVSPERRESSALVLMLWECTNTGHGHYWAALSETPGTWTCPLCGRLMRRMKL